MEGKLLMNNVRLLVGLRWWSEPGEDGLDTYVFECKVNENANNAMDSRIFWWSLSIVSLYWLITTIACVMAMALTKVLYDYINIHTYQFYR